MSSPGIFRNLLHTTPSLVRALFGLRKFPSPVRSRTTRLIVFFANLAAQRTKHSLRSSTIFSLHKTVVQKIFSCEGCLNVLNHAIFSLHHKGIHLIFLALTLEDTFPDYAVRKIDYPQLVSTF